LESPNYIPEDDPKPLETNMTTNLIKFGKFTAAVAVALTVAVSTPALAKSRGAQAGHAARAQAIERVITQEGVSLDRAQALRFCNDLAVPFKEYTWGGNQASQIYRSCMAQQGQLE
jgi:hypothetical protein